MNEKGKMRNGKEKNQKRTMRRPMPPGREATAKVMKLFVLLLLAWPLAVQASGADYGKADSLKVMRLLEAAYREKPTTNWMVYFARLLRGVPYVAQTLERNSEERLVVNLHELDCTTYVENVLAMSLFVKQRKSTFADYCSLLRQIRYRDGHVAYTDRLHYFTAWIADNTRMGIVKGEVQTPNPPFTAVQTIHADYMSQHPSLYPMLKEHPEWVKDIKAMEDSLDGLRFRYIPKGTIADTPLFRKTIHDGDIIAIITSKKGLDTSHIGIAVWHSDGLHLLNASQVRHKVVEEPWTLRHYMSRHPSQVGIRVVRTISGQSS